MALKPTDSSERIKALMRQHTASVNAATASATVIPTTATRPPPTVSASETPSTPQANSKNTEIATGKKSSAVKFDRITIRLTVGEVDKINDVIIATQQVNRRSKVTTTDILRAALRRIKTGEALPANVLESLREQDGRIAKR